MKTKFKILALFIALFGFTAANAQGKNKGNKSYKSYAKMKKHNKNDDYYRKRSGVIYRDRDDDDDHRYRRSRRGTVYNQGGIFGNRDDDYNRRRGTVYYSNQRVYYPAHGVKNLPPGQAKKIYGHQSAKAFAPGQQKKVYQNNAIYYPQRRVVYNQRYDDDYYRQRNTGELARRIGSIFGL